MAKPVVVEAVAEVATSGNGLFDQIKAAQALGLDDQETAEAFAEALQRRIRAHNEAKRVEAFKAKAEAFALEIASLWGCEANLYLVPEWQNGLRTGRVLYEINHAFVADKPTKNSAPKANNTPLKRIVNANGVVLASGSTYNAVCSGLGLEVKDTTSGHETLKAYCTTHPGCVLVEG